MVLERHIEPKIIEQRPVWVAPTTVPQDIHPFIRIDSSSIDGLVNGKNSVEDSRRVNLRGGPLAIGGGIGLGLAGLGLGVGLTEGIPRIFGGQGPLGAAVNPDKQPGTPGGPPAPDPNAKLLFSPLTILAIGAVIVAALVWGGK